MSRHLKERRKYKKEMSSCEDFLLNLVITLGIEVQSWRPSVNWSTQPESMGCMAADKHSIAGFEVEVGGHPQMSSSEVDFPKWK